MVKIILHGASLWNSQAHSGNDSVSKFDWINLGLLVKSCIVSMFLTISNDGFTEIFSTQRPCNCSFSWHLIVPLHCTHKNLMVVEYDGGTYLFWSVALKRMVSNMKLQSGHFDYINVLMMKHLIYSV